MPHIGPDHQWQLFFEDVEVEEDRLIGGENGGLGAVFDGLNPERIMGATIACGAGRFALAKGADYARERNVWGAPIGTHQGISHPLAQAKIELELAKLMTQKAAALYDAGAKGAGEASNMAKYAAAEAAIKCVDQAIQTHGGNGFALEYGLSQMWWGVRLTRTAPVSREMILNYVAEHSLGLPKSYGPGACRSRAWAFYVARGRRRLRGDRAHARPVGSRQPARGTAERAARRARSTAPGGSTAARARPRHLRDPRPDTDRRLDGRAPR